MIKQDEMKPEQTKQSHGQIKPEQIKDGTPVVCSKGGQFGVVDHMEGNATIKLQKDAKGQHHFIPMTWVKSVDDKVHVDRPGDQAMREWKTTAN
jgi:hypothetical protein